MSRIGKHPVPIPQGVEVAYVDGIMSCKGKNGALTMQASSSVLVEIEEASIVVKPVDNSKKARSQWGLMRTLINNMVLGVSEGFSKELEIRGVGYRAAMQGNDVKLNLGFSHDVVYKAPEGIKLECPEPTRIVVSGISKQSVGQVAAEIRSYRKPEPYKGKGVRYKGEFVIKKEGKKK